MDRQRKRDRHKSTWQREREIERQKSKLQRETQTEGQTDKWTSTKRQTDIRAYRQTDEEITA